MTLNSTMKNAVRNETRGANHRGNDKAIYDHHVCPAVGHKADIGPGDISLKFFDIMDAHKPAELDSPMGTTIKMGKK